MNNYEFQVFKDRPFLIEAIEAGRATVCYDPHLKDLSVTWSEDN